MRRVLLLAPVVLLALGLAASGRGAASQHPPPAAQPVAMIATPQAILASCRRNRLLRPICPRRLPAWGSAHNGSQGYYCMTHPPRGETVREMLFLFKSNRCVSAEWSYENGESLRAYTVGRALWEWDGRRWVPGLWTMLPPPFHVGIDLEASVGSQRSLAGGSTSSPNGARAISDALLDPSRTRTISLGWVSWSGQTGQLVLTPRGACETGDALALYLPRNAERVSYTITLDAWMPAARLTGKGIDRTFRFESGPALTRAIATLEAIVESAHVA